MKKETELKCSLCFAVLVILGFISVCVWVVSSVVTEQDEWLEKVEFAKTLDWGQPENATITYGTSRYAKEGEWYKVRVFIEFENEPWIDYSGVLWFTMDGRTHFGLI